MSLNSDTVFRSFLQRENSMVRMLTLFVLILFCFSGSAQVDTSKSKFWMMTYFVNGGGEDEDYGGPRLAFSSDTTGVPGI